MDRYEVFIPAGQKAVGQLKVRRLIDGLDEGKAWDVVITKHRQKRSLDANAYCWKLLDEIASRLHESKETLYRGYIKNVGGNAYQGVFEKSDIDKVAKLWSDRGIGWGVRVIGERQDGKWDVEMYYGSSAFDTAQMSRLIDLIVQDCIALDIPTKSPDELEQLVKEWGCE